MPTLCQIKASFFHSENRKRNLESKLNSKRVTTPKIRSIKNKHATIWPLLNEAQMMKISEEFDKFVNSPNEMLPLISKFRSYYTYEKENIKFMKMFMLKFIDFTVKLSPMEVFEELVYECSWVLINYLGLEEFSFDMTYIDKLCHFFLTQIKSKNIKFQQEVKIVFLVIILRKSFKFLRDCGECQIFLLIPN